MRKPHEILSTGFSLKKSDTVYFSCMFYSTYDCVFNMAAWKGEMKKKILFDRMNRDFFSDKFLVICLDEFKFVWTN